MSRPVKRLLALLVVLAFSVKIIGRRVKKTFRGGERTTTRRHSSGTFRLSNACLVCFLSRRLRSSGTKFVEVEARPPSIKRATYRYDPDSIPQNEQILRLFLHLAAHTANRLIFLKNDARSKLPNRTHESAANNKRIPPNNETGGFAANQTIPHEPSVRLFDEAADVKNNDESRAGNITEEKGFASNQTSGDENTKSTNVAETLNVTKNNVSNPKIDGDQGIVSDQTNLNVSESLQSTTTEETRNINNSNDSKSQIGEENAKFARNETTVEKPISSPVGIEKNSDLSGTESEPKNEVVEGKSSSVNQQVNTMNDDNQREQPSNLHNSQDYQKNVNHSNTLPKETSIDAIHFGLSVTSTHNKEAQNPVQQRRKGLLEGTSGLLSIPRELGKTIVSVAQPRKTIGTISSGLKTFLPSAKEDSKEARSSKTSDVAENQMEIANRLLFVDDKSGSQNGGIPRIADSVTEPKLMNSGTPVEPIVQQIPGSDTVETKFAQNGSVLSKAPAASVMDRLLENFEPQSRPEVRLYQNKVSEAVETILSPVTTTFDETSPKVVKDVASMPANKIESVVPLFRAFPETNVQSNPNVSDSETSTPPKSDTRSTKMDEGLKESLNTPIGGLDSFVQQGLKSNHSSSDRNIFPSKINGNVPGAVENIGKIVPTVNEPKSLIPMFRAFPDFEISQNDKPTLPERIEEKQSPNKPMIPQEINNNHDTVSNYSGTELSRNRNGNLKKCNDSNNVGHYSNQPTAIRDQFHAENSAIQLTESLPFSGEVHLDDDLNGSISESALKDISEQLLTVLQSANEEQMKNDLGQITDSNPTNKVETFTR